MAGWPESRTRRLEGTRAGGRDTRGSEAQRLGGPERNTGSRKAGGGGIRTREAHQELTHIAHGRTRPLCDLSMKSEEGVRLPPSKLTFHRIRSSKDGSGRLPDLSTSTVCTCGVVSTTAFLKMWRFIYARPATQTWIPRLPCEQLDALASPCSPCLTVLVLRTRTRLSSPKCSALSRFCGSLVTTLRFDIR